MEVLMKTKGIRIFDRNGNVLQKLSDILQVFTKGSSLYWAILCLDGTPQPGQGKYLTEYMDKINNSKNGMTIKWDELFDLSNNFFQMFETIILGSQNEILLKRYNDEKEMYTSCEVVIDLIDCAFWEVYSKDFDLILKLKNKFNEVEDVKI